MIEKLVQSIHESIKKRNLPSAYVLDSTDGSDSIHRGYIKNSTWPIKINFTPSKKQQFKNEGMHVYSFADGKLNGRVEINHRMNGKRDSGHETISIVDHDVGDFERNVDLQRAIIPAVLHHITSHDPDIIKFKKGFRYTKELLSRLDPEGKKFTVSKSNAGTTLKKTTPIDAKAARIIQHIRKKYK